MTRPLMEKTPGQGWGLDRSFHVADTSTWFNGRVRVISSLTTAEAPDGSGEAIPQWHISVTECGKRPSGRVVRRALRAFGMADAEEDNHHPGNARHFFKPVDSKRRISCECKTTEMVVKEPDGYTWTNPTEGPYRGCELARLIGKTCSIHDGGEL